MLLEIQKPLRTKKAITAWWVKAVGKKSSFSHKGAWDGSRETKRPRAWPTSTSSAARQRSASKTR